MTDKLDLTALLGSRICHDLISPIGAIGNGVELLMYDMAASSPELQLITDSVAHANARIRYFRIAFGLASAAQQIGRSELVSILTDLTRGSRLSIDWHSSPELPKREAKLIFLAIQCFECAMPHGGKLRIAQGETGWSLQAEAARLRFVSDMWEVLSNPASDYAITPAEVQFLLLRDEISRQQRRLALETDETTIRMSL